MTTTLLPVLKLEDTTMTLKDLVTLSDTEEVFIHQPSEWEKFHREGRVTPIFSVELTMELTADGGISRMDITDDMLKVGVHRGAPMWPQERVSTWVFNEDIPLAFVRQ